ncbi:MAG: hypothetical protein LBR12_02720 [Opitutaceae bacterium]|jgi:hypothetical protein|nr:hypothetical protein [Opitutaceae bacterium]
MRNALRLAALAGTLLLAACSNVRFGWQDPAPATRQVAARQPAATETPAPQVAAPQVAARETPAPAAPQVAAPAVRQPAAAPAPQPQPAPARQAAAPVVRQPAARQPAAQPEEPAVEWRHTASKDYEQEQPGSGLGFSRRFTTDISGGVADLFVYSANQRWADGTDDPGFDAHFRGCISEVGKAATAGVYSNLTLKAPFNALVDGLRTRGIKMTYTDGGKDVESYLYLTALNGKLVKLRATFDAPADAAAVNSLTRLLARTLPLSGGQ